MNNLTNRFAVVLCMLVLVLSSSCRDDFEPITKPSDFVKEKREGLGDMIQVAIAQHPDEFPVLPNIPPYDTTVYWYVQTLYNQVTNSLRLDNLANENDQWDFDRPWRVTVLDEAEINAFCIPGGHFYITTGFLKALETEHELYYILAFEAVLMNDRTLLDRLISEHNTTKLSNIGKRIPNGDGTNAFTLAQTLRNLEFDDSEVMHTDALAADQICKSSIFNRLGVISILDRLQHDGAFRWLETRYYDSATRKDYIQTVLNPEGTCGDFIQNGGYERYVLDVLE
jgi:predicted Zn-dependent protease